MRRRAGAVAVIVLATALPVVVRAQTSTAPQIEVIPEGIVRLLDDYGRAFQAKDRGLLEGTLDPALRDTELRAIDNARDVPFREFRVVASTQFSGNLAYRRVRAIYPDKQVATYQVTEESTLDVETVPYEEDGAYTFVRSEANGADPYDGWRLASKKDLEVLGFFSPHHLWDTGPVTLLRSEHFVLLTHPEVLEEMRPVLEVSERAYAKATAFWPRPVQERYVIIVPATTPELGQLIHATIDLEKFVAFVAAGADQEKGWEPTGPRMFVHLSHLRNYGTEGQLEIIAHELLHAITRPVSGPHIPVWIEEGLANAGGGTGGRASQARAGPPPDEFPSDEQFVAGPVADIIRRYDQSQEAIQAVIEAFGHDGLARFYERLGSARVVAGTDTYHVSRAAEEVLQWSEDEWIAAWHKRLG